MHPIPLRAQDLEAAHVPLLLPCLRTYVCVCSKKAKEAANFSPHMVKLFFCNCSPNSGVVSGPHASAAWLCSHLGTDLPANS